MNTVMNMDDIIIQKIVEKIVPNFHPEKIYLFGSYAWGSPTKDSDLDIMIIVSDSKEKTYERGIQARRIIGDIPFSLDVLVWTKSEFSKFELVKQSLQYKILQKGKLLYDRPKD